MSQGKLARRLRRPIRDFLFGLALFCAIAASGVADRSHRGGLLAGAAHAGWLEELVEAPTGPDARAVQTAASGPWSSASVPHQVMIVISLATAFGLVFAVNLWFARHLRRAHAVYRRDRRM